MPFVLIIVFFMISTFGVFGSFFVVFLVLALIVSAFVIYTKSYEKKIRDGMKFDEEKRLRDDLKEQERINNLFPPDYPMRFRHMQILGTYGAGKTSLLSHLLKHDLTSDEVPGLIYIDPARIIIDQLTHLALFDPDNGPLKDRLIILSPRYGYMPALNIFDVKGRDDKDRQLAVANAAIRTFEYMFTMLDVDPTGKQRVPFRYLVRLLLSLPELTGKTPTIVDMLDFLDTPERFKPLVEQLGPIERRFFEREFYDSKSVFSTTKKELSYRIYGMLDEPRLQTFFTSPYSRIDIFEELQKGSIILVDTAIDLLGQYHAYFGQFIILLVLQAIYERIGIAPDKRRPAFLVIDEANEFLQKSIEDILLPARQCRVGCVFAHQFITKCTKELQSSLAALAVKLASSSVTDEDRSIIAKQMNIDDSFIRMTPSHQWAYHQMGWTGAVHIAPPLVDLEKEPRMSAPAYKRLLEMNRAKVGPKDGLPRSTGTSLVPFGEVLREASRRSEYEDIDTAT